MARIVLSTIGTRGDLNPFIALGLGLRARGHDTVFAVEQVFSSALGAEGFAVHTLPGDVISALAPHVKRATGGLTPVPSIRVIVDRWLAPTLRGKVEELRRACEGADLLVARALHLAAPIVAELTGIPWVYITMTPLTVPSDDFNPQLLPTHWLGRMPRLANRLQWAAIAAEGRRLADDRVNKVRSELGLAVGRNLLGVGNHSCALTAVVASPAFMPPPRDWPPYARMTGYCFWDTPDGWQAPRELSDFLAGSAPIVAMSFGSMAPYVGDALAHLYLSSLSAVKAVGARALVIGPGAGSLPANLPSDVLALPFVPFSRVYPFCSAVIHHGGPYTVAEALRAGVPSMVVPWGIDQFFTASQVHRLGAGRWIHHRSFTPRAAERALSDLLRNERYRDAARSVAAKLAQEDGVATLCEAIDATLAEEAAAS